MQKQKMILLLSLALATSAASATERKIKGKNDEKFAALIYEEMKPNEIYFNQTKIPVLPKNRKDDKWTFTAWKREQPVESSFLTPWESYKEPVFKRRTGERPLEEKLIVYVARSKAVVNRALQTQDIKDMSKIEFVKSLDAVQEEDMMEKKEEDRTVVMHELLREDQTMPVLVKSGALAARKADPFAYCNKERLITYVARHLREIDLEPLERPDRPWCSVRDLSICVSSCSLFNAAWTGLTGAANAPLRVKGQIDRLKDPAIATQTEFRVFLRPEDMGRSKSIKELTKLDTEVIGVLEANSFYVNEVIQYATFITVFQRHPTDSSKTVVSSYFAIGLRKRSFEEHAALQDVIMGRSDYLNTATGFTAGLPVFTALQMKRIVEVLDQ